MGSSKRESMSEESDAARILVVADVEETRDGIERLLQKDAYRVDPARHEGDAVVIARRDPPDLILVSLGGPASVVVATAGRIRDRAGLSEEVPVVVFGLDTVDEGAELEIRKRIFIIRPDNFDQLRNFLARLLADWRPPTV
jgi:DNA-binding response OmpR family regulator